MAFSPMYIKYISDGIIMPVINTTSIAANPPRDAGLFRFAWFDPARHKTLPLGRR